MNSFRGGPVRAMPNAIDSVVDQKNPHTSGQAAINKTVNIGESKKERPNSSKPFIKNSFINDSSDVTKGPLS